MHPSPLELAYLSSKLRQNRQRLLVVRLLAEADDHPTTEMLYQRARLQDQTIGRTAVYRALSALVLAGLATAHQPGRGMFRYEDATVGAHAHLMDLDTGEMINVTDPELEAAIVSVARRHGFRCDSYNLVMKVRRLKPERAASIPPPAGRLKALPAARSSGAADRGSNPTRRRAAS